MLVDIDRVINILTLLNKCEISSEKYNSTNDSLFRKDINKYKFDINRKAHDDYNNYFDKLPKELNENVRILYKFIANPYVEIYLDDWILFPLSESINKYMYYIAQNQHYVFDVAYKYNGMGHVIILSCDLENHLLFYRQDGGSNDYDREYNLNWVLDYKKDKVSIGNDKKRRKMKNTYSTVEYFPFKKFKNDINA